MTEARNDAYSTAFIASTEKKEKWLKKNCPFFKKIVYFFTLKLFLQSLYLCDAMLF